MERYTDRCIDASSAVVQTLQWSAMAQRQLSQKARLSIYHSLFIPILICGYKLLAVSERMRLQIAAEISFEIR